MENSYELGKAPIWATVFYAVLFFIVLLATWFWWALLESPTIWNWLSFFTWSWVPASIPLAVLLMWFNYSKRRYERMDNSRKLPLVAFIAFLIANLTLEMVASMFQ